MVVGPKGDRGEKGDKGDRGERGLLMTPTGALKGTYTLALIALVLVALVAFNVTYTNRVQHQAKRNSDNALARSEGVWCSVIVGILRPDPTTPQPPTTLRAWQVAKALGDIAHAYGCANVPQLPPEPKPTGRSGNSLSPKSGPSRG